MTDVPTTSLPPGQAALEGVALSGAGRASLAPWLAGFETSTVENLTAVLTRARQTR